MRFTHTAGLAVSSAIPRKLRARSLRAVFYSLMSLISSAAIFLLCGLSPTLHAQSVAQTGPQQLSFAGLRAVANQGQINAVQVSAQGDLFLLIDQKDGVRLLKTDPTATTVLAQAQIGAVGDIGLAMALDPAGNVYITGTTSSGALASTSGAVFPTSSGTSVNSFVAKFDGSLNPIFVSFAGGASMAASSIAATADAAFITGSIFSATLPVTAAGIIQSPAYGSTENGFVEKISADGSQLLYATYLSGANGGTTPAAIAADASDNAYIAGTTTSPGYPTIAAIIPAQPGSTSGFLTKLTPAGDGITFSTYIPGAGITSMAIDPIAGNLLLSGAISLGQFPVATVSTPLTATTYQVLARMSFDGSTVLASTALAAGSQSFVSAGPSSTAWVVGSLDLPLLPLMPLSSIGNSFAVRVDAAGVVDQTARFGGIAASNLSYASAPVNLTSIAVDALGSLIAAGSFEPSASQSLLATETFDLPLASAPTAAFPSTVHAAVLPASACSGSLCAGSAAYLARLSIPANAASAAASLALSIDDSPNLTLRNFGSAQATAVQIAVAGFTFATNCATTLPAGGECSIALDGTGPGSITISAANATTQTAALPAITAAPTTVVFSPRQLDFGIVSSASAAVTRTITVTNLTQQSQTFKSALDINSHVTLPYTFAEALSDCTVAGPSVKLLAPGAVCHITVGLTASSSAIYDGPIHQTWRIGTRDVQMTAYGQAAALSLSAGEIDFGTQFTGGLRVPRFLYVSNNSTTAVEHAAVTLPVASAFSVTDRCPGQLEPLTVCQLQLGYQAAHTPASDSVTLSLDQGLTALVTGTTLPQPAGNGASTNPNLSVSGKSLSFDNAVSVTSASSEIQNLVIKNIGQSSFTLSLDPSGDFSYTTNCTANLSAGDSCSVVFTFVPSQPGTRQGLLVVTAGAGFTPVNVTLSGIGTGILLPATNGTLDFGGVIAGQPSIQWYKVAQPFSTFAAASASSTLGTPYTVVLVEDIGYGHGQPPSTAFTTNASGTCINCWLGVRFAPSSAGLETGTLTLTSSTAGSPYVLSLTSNGLALTGLLLTPVLQDFGPIPIHSTSAAILFTITNLVTPGASIDVATPVLTGDFAVLNAQTGVAICGGPLAYAASCFVEIIFSPTASGPRTGTLAVQAGSANATAALSGYGSPDPGISLNPAALVFNNVPGTGSTVQSVVVRNTAAFDEQIGVPVASTTNSVVSSFTASSSCAPTLAAGATCSIVVTFVPTTAASAGVLSIPVIVSAGGATTTYTVPLTGAYTTADAGLRILASDTQYGPQATGANGVTRQFTIGNLTQKSLALSIALPRQFVLSGPPCSGLAPNASCNFSVAFLPLDNGDITGTLFALGTPTDGSATLNGLGYVEGYGIGPATLSITGGLLPGNILGFGQVPSGQSVQRILTLTNTSATASLTIRRVTTQWPFLATTTCGATLSPSASCTVTLAYTPLNQISASSALPPSIADAGTLVVESDAASSPDRIDLTGSSTATIVASPSNTAPLAAFVASQSSLTFATTNVGTVSAPQTVTLANTGTATLTIFGIQTIPDFTIASNCSTVVPGSSCTLTVTFTPQGGAQQGAGSGLRIGAIEISSNASTLLEFISLVGVSDPSTLALAPVSLNFGTVLVGASPALSVQVNNTGTGPTTVTAITATGDYTAANGTCPASGGSLAAGATCALQVTFSPTQSGTRPGTLSVASSATALPLIVPLAGVGIESRLQILPSSVSFGPTTVGTSTNQSLTLANMGTAAITGIALAVTGDYSIGVPCAFTTLLPGGSCSVTLIFTPTATGVRTSTLTVSSSDPTSPSAIPLTGAGTESHLQISPASLSFGSIGMGASATQPLTLANGGTATITGIVFAVSGDYAVSAQCAFATLSPGSSCTVNLIFTPTATGARNGTLTVTSSDATSPSTIPLTGAGIQSDLRISPANLSFRSITVGASSSQSLALTNGGTATITGIAVAVSGDYAVTGPCSFTSLSPGSSCTVTLLFTPTATGARNGTLTILSSDAASPAIVPLTGTGATLANGSFTLTASGSSTASATVSSGSPATYNLGITPLNGFAGTVILNCTPVAPAAYAYCSLLPSSVTLASSAQTSVATVTTVISIAAATPVGPIKRSFGDTALCLLFPALIFSWKSRTSRHRAWRVVGPIGWAIVSSIALITAGGCGGNSVSVATQSNLRYAAAGTYQYQVTASSTNSGIPIAQTVLLNLTVQ